MASCTSATLKQENEELLIEVERLREEAARQSQLAMEAAAMARMAQAGAEAQAALSREQQLAAEKALANCK